MKTRYLGYEIGQTVTSTENVRSQTEMNDAVLFRPGMTGTIEKICPYVSKARNTPGRNFFVVRFEYAGETRRVGLNTKQICRPPKGA